MFGKRCVAYPPQAFAACRKSLPSPMTAGFFGGAVVAGASEAIHLAAKEAGLLRR
jgi:hypothetical protein